MYKKRIESIFEKTEAELLLIGAQPEVFYLSGFKGDDAYLVITESKKYTVTDSRYFIQAGEQAKDFELVDISQKSPYELIKSLKKKKVGFLDKKVTVKEFEKMKEKLSGVEFTGVSEAIEQVRRIKDETEVKKIRRAAQIADSAFSHILKYVKKGVSEREIGIELEFFMRRQGAEGISFETIVASGKRSAMPHGVASEKIIENGDFVTLDYGCVYDGYVSDMTRTVAVGEADKKQREIYNIVLKAQKAALAAIAQGKKASDIDKIARSKIFDEGYGKNFGHGLGHSLGLYVHEAPSLSPKSDAILKSGMLMTVEPGIYVENFGGVRIEDLVLITDGGCENFTSSPKELIIV